MHSIYCYVDSYKKRGKKVCEQILRSVDNGQIITNGIYYEGPALFYGCTPKTLHALKLARQNKNYPWYYVDNGYFGGIYQGHKFFRISKNELQYTGPLDPDFERLRHFNLKIEPQRRGEYILFCPPGKIFMQCTASIGYLDWKDKKIKLIRENTNLPIVVREKPKNINEYKRDPSTIALQKAHAVVTHSSNIAVEALLLGVPTFTSREHSATIISYNNEEDLIHLDDPKIPQNRKEWAATLANRQWGFGELWRGDFWRKLNIS
jgi:hypothetical protein